MERAAVDQITDACGRATRRENGSDMAAIADTTTTQSQIEWPKQMTSTTFITSNGRCFVVVFLVGFVCAGFCFELQKWPLINIMRWAVCINECLLILTFYQSVVDANLESELCVQANTMEWN